MLVWIVGDFVILLKRGVNPSVENSTIKEMPYLLLALARPGIGYSLLTTSPPALEGGFGAHLVAHGSVATCPSGRSFV